MDISSRKVKEAYESQRTMAKTRGLDWGFTLETWAEIWRPHWENRGKLRHQLCMGRKGDQGGYTPDNVYIITNRENSLETLERREYDSKEFEPRNTKAYYVYNDKLFEKQPEVAEYIGCCLRWVTKLVEDGTVEKYRINKPRKWYCTPYGDFTKASQAVEATRISEQKEITRQTMFHRYRNDKYPTFYIETRQEPDTRLN
ncbi:hypothetical protein [Vibrio campbellii]|uniref:hypothetical protein n=1 Tax=Vibrio campbellii TaxID=680 RepID=UPI000CD35D2F|nr:hypothetical protein [Vibrio campbellii]AUW07504.1 hypothetical protein C1N51_28215 [Vibrio campbellii]